MKEITISNFSLIMTEFRKVLNFGVRRKSYPFAPEKMIHYCFSVELTNFVNRSGIWAVNVFIIVKGFLFSTFIAKSRLQFASLQVLEKSPLQISIIRDSKERYRSILRKVSLSLGAIVTARKST